MASARIDGEFRATVVRPGLMPPAPARSADSLLPLRLPPDQRHATRGVRGTMRWSQTRLGRHVRQETVLGGDRLDLSEGARRVPPGGDLDQAEETLDHILGEFRRRGFENHPRARALVLLKERLVQEREEAAPRPETATAKATETVGLFEFLGELWDTLLSMVQNPDEKALHRKAVLEEIRVRTDLGDRRGAERRLKLLLVRDPDDADAHARLGRLYLESGSHAAARPHLVAAAKARPAESARHIDLGELHYRRGEPQAALESFGRALRLRPDHSDANAWLGILAHEGDRPVEALRFLERAIAFDPNHAVARYYLAQVSLAQGDELRARYQLDLVRRLDPGADLARFRAAEPAALPARTGMVAFTGWVVPRAGRLAV